MNLAPHALRPQSTGAPSPRPPATGASKRPHVTIRGLSKRFDDTAIYDNFDLDIPRGELISIDLGDDPERVAHYVHVQDSSTERQYYLRVPPTITSADEAVAWTFGMDAQEYQPEQEA